MSEVKPTVPTTYRIEDLKGEEIKGTFYAQELQKSTQEEFRIEKVIKKRTTKSGGEKEVYVKWKGYSNEFNSWIPESDLRRLRGKRDER